MAKLALIFVLMFSMGSSATSVMFPKSLVMHLGDMKSEFPFAALHSVRQMIATELAHGHVKFFHEENLFNNSVEICVEADWETLSRLHHAFLEIPSGLDVSRPEIVLNSIRCPPVAPDSQPVPR